jgi:hypothetical protein
MEITPNHGKGRGNICSHGDPAGKLLILFTVVSPPNKVWGSACGREAAAREGGGVGLEDTPAQFSANNPMYPRLSGRNRARRACQRMPFATLPSQIIVCGSPYGRIS